MSPDGDAACLIEVRCIAHGDPQWFEVVVRQGRSMTRHDVTMSRADFKALAGDLSSPEHCIHAAFRFLLDREPSDSILARFDVTVIGRYFPEFRRDFPRYLEKP